MERWTSRDVSGYYHLRHIHGGKYEPTKKDLIQRVGQYEDTGLEPEDVTDLMAAHGTAIGQLTEYRALSSIAHLRELVQAEKDGRLVVLPCKVGDTVYRVLTTRDCPPVLSEAKIETVGQAADLIGKIGKHKLLSYYLTREEAEAALTAKGVHDG